MAAITSTIRVSTLLPFSTVTSLSPSWRSVVRKSFWAIRTMMVSPL
jgi:hypothetical protein